MTEIKVNFIIEMLGRPPEHLQKTLEQFTESLEKEKGVSVVGKKIYEPKQLEENKNLYSSFTEINLQVESLTRLIELIFIYMPSSIEITDPQELKLRINDTNMILNSLAARLHRYDAIAKRLTMEKSILENQLREHGEKAAIPEVSIAGKKIKASKGKENKGGKVKKGKKKNR